MTMKKLLLALLLGFAGNAWSAATYSRVKTWSSGETLTASDLNAEFNNILTNGTTAGLDDYSATATEMRAVTDPYPAASESLATSLQGELERMRYQLLELKKSIQADNVSYWYQDLPTAGIFTISGSSVGVNDTTPAYSLDVTGTANVTGNTLLGGTLGVTNQITASSHVVITGNITTANDDVDISSHVAIVGNLSVSGTLTVSGGSLVIAATDGSQAMTDATFTLLTFTESTDILSEFNGTTFTATAAGNYQICASAVLSDDSATAIGFTNAEMYVNRAPGSIILGRAGMFTVDSTSDIETLDTNSCGIYSLDASDTITVSAIYDDISGNDDGQATFKRLSILKIL
jgi:hypothetical protein